MHKRVLKHPFSIFILLCVGVLLTGITFKANADDLAVKARVAGIAPTTPAVITSPVEGSVFKKIPVNVAGTCPSASYVEIYNNGVFRGSALCSAGNEFNLQVSLFEGNNQLIARVFNYADQEGPPSVPVNVIYIPPPPPTSAPPSSNPNPSEPTSVYEPFLLSTKFKIRGYYTGQKVAWTLNIIGGLEPYTVKVIWGDGTSNNYKTKNTAISPSHVYTKAGGYKGYCPIKVYGYDSAGQRGYLQVFVIVNEPGNTGNGLASINESPPAAGIFSNNRWLWVAWPSYAVVTLMSASFWLGERQEFQRLLKGRKLR